MNRVHPLRSGPHLLPFSCGLQGEKFSYQLRCATSFISVNVAATPQASDPHYLNESLSPTRMKQTWRKRRWQPSYNACSLPPQRTDKESQRFGPTTEKLKILEEGVFIPSFLPSKHTAELLKALCQRLCLRTTENYACFLTELLEVRC